MPIKIIDNSSEAKPEDLAKAIEVAIEKKVNVINISLGMVNVNQKVREQVLSAISKNISIVSSAGNVGEDLLYPASEEKVFSVIARDINNVDVAFSSKGTKKSFSCPGVHIKIDSKHYVSGTSFACSFLAGTISIIKENKNDYNTF